MNNGSKEERISSENGLEIPRGSYEDMVSKLELIISLCDRELLMHPVCHANSTVKNDIDQAVSLLYKAKFFINRA
jgi:hypothetical protein